MCSLRAQQPRVAHRPLNRKSKPTKCPAEATAAACNPSMHVDAAFANLLTEARRKRSQGERTMTLIVATIPRLRLHETGRHAHA